MLSPRVMPLRLLLQLYSELRPHERTTCQPLASQASLADRRISPTRKDRRGNEVSTIRRCGAPASRHRRWRDRGARHDRTGPDRTPVKPAVVRSAGRAGRQVRKDSRKQVPDTRVQICTLVLVARSRISSRPAGEDEINLGANGDQWK